MHQFFLVEANYANSGDTEVVITNKEGEEIEVLHPFNKIFEIGVMKPVTKTQVEEKVKTWFNSNFKNWLKNEATGYENHHDRFLSTARFTELLYPDLDATMDDLADEFPDMKHDEIIKAFPDYIQKKPDGVKIFAGGRKFRMNTPKFTTMLGELKDYLNAVAQNHDDRNMLLMPDIYFVKDLSKLPPAEAIKKAFEYHEYCERMSNKLSDEQKKAAYKSMKKGVDYEDFFKLSDGNMVIKAVSASFASTEGKAMGHCVGTYGRDVENGKIVILAVMKDGVSKATLEMDPAMKTIRQLKGPKNGPVISELHKPLQLFIKEKGYKFGGGGYGATDYRFIGMQSSDVSKIEESATAFYENFSTLLMENDETPKKKTATKQATDAKNKLKFKTDSDQLPALVGKTRKAADPEGNTPKSDDLTLRKAGEAKTREKMQDAKMGFKSFLHFLNMDLTGLEDKIDPTVSTEMIVRPETANLPKVINSAMRVAGMVEPEWHMVKHLPGYMSQGIRAIGRQVFTPFTKTKIEDIQVIASLGGSGPNSTTEINSVAKFLLDHGTKSTEASMQFHDRIPGYEADMKVYTFANYTFLLVKDHAGNYIYSWPSTDNKNKLADKSLGFLRIGNDTN